MRFASRRLACVSLTLATHATARPLTQEFKKLVETLLEFHLADMGVTGEQFMEACEKASSNAVAAVVFQTVLAAEDYLYFRKMMIKRNAQLEAEAATMLRTVERNPAASVAQRATLALASEADATDESVAAAVQASKAEYERLVAEQQAREAAMDADLRAALAASLTDAELAEQRRRAEEAEVERAIAMSLALEEEHARRAAAASHADAAGVARLATEAKARLEDEHRMRLAVLASSPAAKAAAAAGQESTPPLPALSMTELAALERRRAAVDEQRALILRMKAVQRDEALRSYEASAGKTASPARGRASATGAAAGASPAPAGSASLPPLSPGGAPVGAPSDAQDHARAKMRLALASRLKADAVSGGVGGEARPSRESAVQAVHVRGATGSADDGPSESDIAARRARLEAERRAYLDAMHGNLRAGAGDDDEFVYSEK